MIKKKLAEYECTTMRRPVVSVCVDERVVGETCKGGMAVYGSQVLFEQTLDKYQAVCPTCVECGSEKWNGNVGY